MAGVMKRAVSALVLIVSAFAVCVVVSETALAISNDATVYVSPYGKAYHLDKDCNGLSNASSVRETTYDRVGNRDLCELCEARHQGGNSHTYSYGWRNSGKGWWYQYLDGSYSLGWDRIGGSWYHFDSNGYMDTGWLKDGGCWYYLSSSGAMATGWVRDGGAWYYMSGSGAMQTGWQAIGGYWYCFSNSGVMYADTWVGDYYLGSSGAMLTDCLTPDGYWVDARGKWVA